jgi:DNA-binding GntR family transcriptional regulator
MSVARTDNHVVRGALVDAIAQEIQSRVMSGEIEIGSWLRQESLAVEFKVSRTPVREALRKLEAAGIAELVINRGAVVRGPTPRDIREAYLVRAELEGLAAELATEWISEEQLAELREVEGRMRRSVEQVLARRRRGPALVPRDLAENVWVPANERFHDIVKEASGNRRLQEAITDLIRRIPRSFGAEFLTWAAAQAHGRVLREDIAQHRRIREAIERRNPAGARKAMAEHIRGAGDDIALWFERRAGQSMGA